MHHSKDVAAAPANAAGSGSGSFSRLTHAAEFYASQAATQAAGLFSYKTGDEKSQERKRGTDRWVCLKPDRWFLSSLSKLVKVAWNHMDNYGLW